MKPIVEPCGFGDICRNMTPDGAETLYEIRVFEARGHYIGPTKALSSWQSHKIHTFATRCQSEATAKRAATAVAKQFDYVDLITLWKRDVKHHIDNRYPMREIWRREKMAAAKSWHPWEEVTIGGRENERSL